MRKSPPKSNFVESPKLYPTLDLPELAIFVVAVEEISLQLPEFVANNKFAFAETLIFCAEINIENIKKAVLKIFSILWWFRYYIIYGCFIGLEKILPQFLKQL